MGLYLKQDEARAQLSSRITAELSERLKQRSIKPNNDAEAAVLLKNHRKTTSGGLFWFIVCAVVLLAGLAYVVFIL